MQATEIPRGNESLAYDPTPSQGSLKLGESGRVEESVQK
jgi:hypothetical protein